MTDETAGGQQAPAQLSDGSVLTARTVIVTTGANYRRLGGPAPEKLHGRGVFCIPQIHRFLAAGAARAASP